MSEEKGIEWSEAPTEVIRLAEELIAAYHPELSRANVGFVMRSKRSKSMGKIVLGKASKVPDKLRPYVDYDFLIWLSEPDWENLEPITKRALIDHELCHCDMIGDQPKMRAHDIEEFQCIVERYGLWHPHLKLFGDAIMARQEMLPGLEKQGRVGSVEIKSFTIAEPRPISNDERERQVDDLLSGFLGKEEDKDEDGEA